MGSADPFRDPEQSEPRVKALIYGPSGVGKTWLALTAPGPIAVIDTEGGTAFYANRVGPKGLSPFRVLPTKTFAQVEQAVAFLKANPGAYQTLVIDPVTVLWQVLQEAAQKRRAEIRRSAEADLEMLDWSRIKSAYQRLMNDLVNLDLHVIVTARETDLSEDKVGPNGRKERVKIGVRPDAEKGTTYYFDTVLRMAPDGKARVVIVEKDRTDALAMGEQVRNATFASLFGEALKREGTAKRDVPSDAQAASVDALTTIVSEELNEREETEAPMGHVTRTGKVTKGEGIRSNLLARQTPDGWAVGFLLAVKDATAKPQCVAVGPLGDDLYDVTGGNTEALNKTEVEVEGDLFEVTRPGMSKFYRIKLTRITSPDWTFPAPEPEHATEAPSVGMFDAQEQRDIDAALDEVPV